MKIKNLLFQIISISILCILLCCDDSGSSDESSIKIPSKLNGKWHFDTYAVETSSPGIYAFYRTCDDKGICANLIHNFQETSLTVKKVALSLSGYYYLETVWVVEFKLIDSGDSELLFEVVNNIDADDYYFRIGSKHQFDYWFSSEYLYLAMDGEKGQCCTKI
ncbi:MAG: hypothetical protein CVV44_17245 [Spirochaetae bacterium HGW-Spirochaetae-1]|jgi:hypothetical protein|nr:MAG: hypothetical protein CVV44_17245 [Spirochaetae bacterium HGW-Spirochaetae-1]